MRSFAILALVVGALALPQGVTETIAPSATAPSGCMPTYPGSFEITVVNVTSSSKRSLEARQKSGILTLKLAGGVLTDQADRTGYIASNYQFQFDSPPQTGAIFTSGFSVCGNGSLALGGSAIFYQCYSGGFYNLYDRHWAAQCTPIYLVAMGDNAAITQATDGQPAATTAGVATQLSDGQPGVSSAASAFPVSIISDGQPQAPTAIPISILSDGQPQAPTGGIQVSVLSDGQPQVPTAAASSIVPVASQLSDGQVQATSAAAPTTSSVGPVVSQLSDGQIQASATIYSSANGTVSFTASPSQFTGGAAAAPIFGLGAMAAGVLGAVAML